MREIKFRAWDKKNKKMFDWDFILSQSDGFYDYILEGSLIQMQYTGLKDKNGKEIYEGDIVKVIPKPRGTKGVYDVIYYEDRFLLDGYDNYDHDGYPQFDWKELEIIGNIYENPELLNPPQSE